MNNSPSILDDTRQKAVNISSSNETANLILKAIEILQYSIANGANPENMKRLISILEKDHKQGDMPIHGLVNDLSEAVFKTMNWMADREIQRGVKSELHEIKKESGGVDDLCNMSETDMDGVAVNQQGGDCPLKTVKSEEPTSPTLSAASTMRATIKDFFVSKTERLSLTHKTPYEETSIKNEEEWSDGQETSENENSEDSDDDKENSPGKRPGTKKTISRNGKSTKCDECGKNFTTAGTLRVHKLTHLNDDTAKKPYACDQCDKRFTQAGSLSVHKRKHLDKEDPRLLKFKRIWNCKICGKPYNNRPGLAHHERTHFGEEGRRSFFKCKYCDRGFTMKTALHTHELLHTGDLPFKCELCPRQFNTKFLFNAHMTNHANGTVRIWSGNNISRNHKCTLCPKRFRRDYELAAHVKRHAEDTVGSSSDEEVEVILERFQCLNCKKSYTTKQKLGRHLAAHMKRHAANQPFPCTLCACRYRLRHTLAYHMKTVHGVEGDAPAKVPRPFKCEHCPKSFTAEVALEKHKLIHAGPSSFKCSLCSDHFASMTLLHAHKKTVHDPMPFQCRRCLKKFEDMDTLDEHKGLSKLMKQAGFPGGCAERKGRDSPIGDAMEVVEVN